MRHLRLLLFFSLFAATGFGQEVTETIVVTGSRLSSLVGENTGIRNLVFNREELQSYGDISLVEFLNRLPQFSFGIQPLSPGEDNPGFAAANLRGLGVDKTLMLLNGQRLAKNPSENAADINIIPLAAIERVEVSLDSASALYGSDALAGVINIITRSESDLLSISANFQETALGSAGSQNYNAVLGLGNEEWQSLTVLDLIRQEDLRETERFWFDMFTASNGVPSSYQNNEGQFAPFGGESACPGPIVRRNNGVFCGFDLQPSFYYIVPSRRYSILQDLGFKISKDWSLSVNMLASYKTLAREGLGFPLRGRIVGAARVDELVGSGLLPEDLQGDSVNVQGRFADLPQRSQTRDETLSTTISSAWNLGEDSQLTLNLFQGSSLLRRVREQGYFVNEEMNQAIFSGRYDVFGELGARGDPGAERSVSTEQLFNLYGAELVFSSQRSLSALEKPLKYVLGLYYQNESYEKDCSELLSSGQIFGAGCGKGEGNRQTVSTFFESKLQFSDFKARVAGRADNYSDFGLALTPTISLSWEKKGGFFASLSYSEGFKAPNLSELHDGSDRRLVEQIDYKRCRAAEQAGASSSELELICEEPALFTLVTGGNDDLKEERSQSYLLEIGYEKPAKWGVTASFQAININNIIVIPDIEQVLIAESLGNSVSGVEILRDPTNASDPDSLVSISSGFLNLSEARYRGVDTHVYWQGQFSSLGLRLDSRISYIFSFASERLPGTGFEELAGDFQKPRFRSNNSLSLNLSSHRLSFQVLSLDGYRKNDPSAGRLGDFSTLTASYRLSLNNGLDVSFAGQNLLRSTPPLDRTAGDDRGISGSLYDPRHTTYTLSIAQTW